MRLSGLAKVLPILYICSVKKEQSFSRILHSSYPTWQVAELASRRFSPEQFQLVLDSITTSTPALFSKEIAGHSFEGRPLNLIGAGNGSTTVLLWSQMHGDESTASMAIADILNYLASHSNERTVGTILSSLRLLFLPMLNPDGAARFQRRTAQGIDLNRDAVALCTPEARILKQLQQKHKPRVAFNLHDQELNSVGSSKELTAVSLLSPAIDAQKSTDDVRARSKHLAATLADIFEIFISGKIARYDDTFEPRAFGDSMQRWGTSTVLIESGHMFRDPEKNHIRKLNAVGILAALHEIATGEYLNFDVLRYDMLPFNGKNAYNLIIRNVCIKHRSGESTIADLGISYQVDTHLEDIPMLVDLGDLSTHRGMSEFDAQKREIFSGDLRLNQPFDWRRYFPIGKFIPEY